MREILYEPNRDEIERERKREKKWKKEDIPSLYDLVRGSYRVPQKEKKVFCSLQRVLIECSNQSELVSSVSIVTHANIR